MRGRLFAAVGASLVLLPAPAIAAPVLVMGRQGRVTVRQDRFLSSAALTPGPTNGVELHPVRAGSRLAPGGIHSQLLRLYRRGRITRSDYGLYSGQLSLALRAQRHLTGTRALELGAVIDNLRQMASEGLLTPSRLPVLFLTLNRNRQWWSTGPQPGTWQRVEFAGSQLVWEYYPGQGIELQVLGTFGKAGGLYTAGPSYYPRLISLLNEMIPLAARRGGGLAWEYYFQFDGGQPPWVSAMAQGTALQALSRGFQAAGSTPSATSGASYLQVAHRALSIFTLAPPVGVRLLEPHGSRYLQYSFAPGTDIINAFLQALIGLYDYAQVSGDPLAARLFSAGDAQARAELPSFDTGAWSLYQPGLEDSLSYHILVTGFLRDLCARTQAAIYCREAHLFHSYLKTPPALALQTTRVPARTPVQIQFKLSKYSHVGIVVTCGARTLLATSTDFPYGTNSFDAPPLPAGPCAVRLSATDLAGNFSRIQGTLRVYRRARR